MKKVFMLVALAVSPLMFAAEKAKTARQEVVIQVRGMVCSFCAQGIEKKLKSFPEVQSVSVDLDAKRVSVMFHPGPTLPDDVLKKTIQDSGFDVVSIEGLKK